MVRKSNILIKAIEQVTGKAYYTTMNKTEYAEAKKQFKSIIKSSVA
jgi:hypothetical protein